eukprot:TRINITY_DN1608_c1_g2_i1.p1 TRINITY_DN1608_c1_g2~~TRINITY_DN1608_c1_g2_i1.p1  ORF type:complete len:249 (+),score=19.43 TRINITY_DN1608_c1_g2_i1:132-878(+)
MYQCGSEPSDGRSPRGLQQMWRSRAQKHRDRLKRGWFYRGFRCCIGPPGLDIQVQSHCAIDAHGLVNPESLSIQSEPGLTVTDDCCTQVVQTQDLDENDSMEENFKFICAIQTQREQQKTRDFDQLQPPCIWHPDCRPCHDLDSRLRSKLQYNTESEFCELSVVSTLHIALVASSWLLSEEVDLESNVPVIWFAEDGDADRREGHVEMFVERAKAHGDLPNAQLDALADFWHVYPFVAMLIAHTSSAL